MRNNYIRLEINFTASKIFIFQLGLMRDALVFSKRIQRKIPAVKDQSEVSTWLATNKVGNKTNYRHLSKLKTGNKNI